jgi:hypothetical protein
MGESDGRFHDRETEPIPRRPPIAREPIGPEPIASERIAPDPPAEPIVPDPIVPDPEDEFGDPFVGVPAGGGYYDEPPTFTDDEFSGLTGGDPGPSVYSTSRVAPLDDEPTSTSPATAARPKSSAASGSGTGSSWPASSPSARSPPCSWAM